MVRSPFASSSEKKNHTNPEKAAEKELYNILPPKLTYPLKNGDMLIFRGVTFAQIPPLPPDLKKPT